MKIIPIPQKVTELGGCFELSKAKTVCVSENTDLRINRALAVLCNEIGEKVTPPVINCVSGEITLSCGDMDCESYTLKITPDGISLASDGVKGLFYAIQTLRQIVSAYGENLPCVEIEDAPAFPERGFYHDVTRGRVPTLEQLFKIVDFISYYKINALQLYVEDAFAFKEYEGIMKPEEMLTADEIKKLDDYCYLHFVEFVPSMSTFGHLYNLLQSDRYKHLCGLENYVPAAHYWIEKMRHHTIDVSNPESIELVKSMIDQYVPLFRSEKFNICCDETFDLCKGRNVGKDSGEEYFGFLKKIISHVRSYGKTVMMWGDIALKHPEMLSEIPEGTVMLNWTYSANPDENKVKTLADAGLIQIVCPGTTSWNRFVERLEVSEPNICKLTDYGKKYGALGILNTNWGDFGNICPFNCELYGTVLGAEKGWNPDAALGEDYEIAASKLIYGVDDVNVISLIRELGYAENTCKWNVIVDTVSSKQFGYTSPVFEGDANLIAANIAKTEEIEKALSSLDGNKEIISDLILSCKAIRLMNSMILYTKGGGLMNRVELAGEIGAFLPEYRAQWLRENKESQLIRIERFLAELPYYL
ncbi:MAG: beta-N-acetylhexosaminidase [Firmicutes bacterium]|nr:beta-N-acetylhexosaminidase [Candidatus Colimorpha enterica]